MFSYYLLFETEDQYLRFCDLPDDSNLFDCLNIDIIKDRLCSISRNFPVQFIQKMNAEASVAEFRNAVFCDLYRDSSWQLADELCSEISSLHTRSVKVESINEPMQKRIVGIHILAQYFALLDRLCAFISPFQSIGLRRGFEVFQTYLMKPEIIAAKAAIYRAETLLESYLRVLLKIDRARKTITITDAESVPPSDGLQNLDRLCLELTGVSIMHPFSIVNGSCLSLLEKLTLNRVLQDHADLASAIKEIPEVDMIWDQLLLFQTQICFYNAFIKLTEQLKNKRLPFCFPSFDDSVRICAHGIYDLSLAIHNIEQDDFYPTANSVDLRSDTVGFILTGANQGGKTTYLRSIGIVVYLSMCGCPVPAESIVLFPYHTIFTLFGGGEALDNEASRFEWEAKRYCLHRDSFNDYTLVLLNEYFTGTNRLEAVEILGQCLHELTDKKITYGCVTHFQEIFEILDDGANNHIQYLQAKFSSDIDNGKQYVIWKGHPDGRAYSERITQKLGMTYDTLTSQFKARSDDNV